MSIKSTYGIPRQVAQQVLATSIFGLSNKQLAEMIEILPESYFRNYTVDGTGYSDTDKSMINSADEFFSGK